jgi:plastocyanin
MKKLAIVLVGFSVGIVLTAAAAALPSRSAATIGASAKSHTITITHQTHGCHAWAVDGGRYSASLRMHIATGATIRFIDADVMSHKLIEKSGPAASFRGNRAMNHTGASVKATFAKSGTYKFVTKAGEDYPGVHVKTTGADNVLRLTVKVG